MIWVNVRLQTQTSSDNWQSHIFVLLQPSAADLCNQALQQCDYSSGIVRE